MDSAFGSAKSARDPKTQAIMALKGKVLNTIDKELDVLLANKEIRDLVTALGCGIGERFNLRNLRYGKIILMNDADEDGKHIALLLCTLFLFHLPELVTAGKIYQSIPPLYAVEKGGERYYLYSDDELREHTRQNGSPKHIIRYKGLGEMRPDELEATTMNKSARRLYQLTTSDLSTTIDLFTQLMGTNAQLRRDYIIENSEEGEY